MEEDFTEARISLSRILHKLIFDNYKNNEEVRVKLIEVEKQLTTLKTQNQAISIIDNVIQIIQG